MFRQKIRRIATILSAIYWFCSSCILFAANDLKPKVILLEYTPQQYAQKVITNYQQHFAASASSPVFLTELLEPLTDEQVELRLTSIVESAPQLIVVPTAGLARSLATRTKKIPILYIMWEDPRELGLGRSLSEPNNNLSGITLYRPTEMKSIGLLKLAYPHIKLVEIVAQPSWRKSINEQGELTRYLANLGIKVEFVDIVNQSDVDHWLAQPSDKLIDARFIPLSPAVYDNKEKLIDKMTAWNKPVLYGFSWATRHGGLMSYQQAFSAPYQLLARQIAMVLNGTDVGKIPVERPTNYEFFINPDAAKLVKPAISKQALFRASLPTN